MPWRDNGPSLSDLLGKKGGDGGAHAGKVFVWLLFFVFSFMYWCITAFEIDKKRVAKKKRRYEERYGRHEEDRRGEREEFNGHLERMEELAREREANLRKMSEELERERERSESRRGGSCYGGSRRGESRRRESRRRESRHGGSRYRSSRRYDSESSRSQSLSDIDRAERGAKLRGGGGAECGIPKDGEGDWMDDIIF